MKLESLLIQIACNASSRSGAVDRITGQPVIIWRGNGAIFRCAVFRADPSKEGNLITDFSNITTAGLVIRDGSATGSVLISKTVEVGEFNGGLAWAQWNAGTHGHFDFVLTGADTNQTMGADGKKAIYFAIQLQTTGTDPITIATGTATIQEDGIGEAESPESPEYGSWPKDEADTRHGRRGISLPAWAPDLTALTGGTPECLDAIATLSLEPGFLLALRIGGIPHWYVLESGDAAESAPGIIRPDDFSSPDNEKTWTRYL